MKPTSLCAATVTTQSKLLGGALGIICLVLLHRPHVWEVSNPLTNWACGWRMCVVVLGAFEANDMAGQNKVGSQRLKLMPWMVLELMIGSVWESHNLYIMVHGLARQKAGEKKLQKSKELKKQIWCQYSVNIAGTLCGCVQACSMCCVHGVSNTC